MSKRGRPRKHRIRIPKTDEPLFYQMTGFWNHFINDPVKSTGQARAMLLKYFTRWLAKDISRPSLEPIEACFILLSQNARDANALIYRYSNYLSTLKLEPTTVNNRLVCMASLFKAAQSLGLVDYPITIKKKRVKPYGNVEGPKINTIIDMFKEQNLIISGKHPNPHFRNIQRRDGALRDKAILTMFFPLGLRPIEVANLMLSDVDFENRTIRIKGKWRDQTENLSFPEEVNRALTAWVKLRSRREGPLFTKMDNFRIKSYPKLEGLCEKRIGRIVAEIGERIDTSTNCRGFRHAAITEVVTKSQKEGYPIEECLKFSRHSSLDTLLIYRDHIENRQGEFAKLISESLADVI